MKSKWLIGENQSIEQELATLSQENLEKLRYFFGSNVALFANWIEKMKLILIDLAKPHTLLETFLLFYEMVDPDKTLHTILSPLPEETQEWILHWKEEIFQLLQETCFSRDHLEDFIRNALIPVKPHLEKIYTQAETNSLRNLITKKKKLWLDFLQIYPIENLKTYIYNVSAVHEHCAHLLLSSPCSTDVLQAFMEKALTFAKNHTPQELQSFLQEKDPSQSLNHS